MRLLLLLALLVATPAAAQTVPVTEALRARIAAIAEVEQGRVGVVATDLTSGATVSVGGDRAFPMASAVKVAVAATWLDGVDKGRWRMSTLYRLDDGDRVRSDGITDMLPHAGVALSGANLVELMLTVSDNTATDMLLKAVGGPRAVTAWLGRAGVRGQRVDRSIARLLIDIARKPLAPGLTDAQSLARFMPVEPWKTDDEKWPVNAEFDADPRDSSTPAAMAGLLGRLHGGTLLSESSTRFLFDVMGRCKTGGKRIKALLPPGTRWAHKTGTLPGISNDVGVLTLPDGRAIAVAAFVVGIAEPAARDAKLAEIGRLIYDGFLLAR